MWLISVRSDSDNGLRLVKYSLLALIVFMLVCTFLAIILVSFVSNYSTVLHERKQGIISVLVLIAANYCLGLAALWRSNLLMLAIFTAVDIGMAILCLFGTHQYHQHMGNIGALVLFIITSLLSLALLLLSCRQKAIRQSASIQTAAVNCYHHVLDDWYDYAPGTPGATSDKEELITNQLLMPYHGEEELCVEDFLNSGSPPTSGTFCTVESTEERYLNGNRYAL